MSLRLSPRQVASPRSPRVRNHHLTSVNLSLSFILRSDELTRLRSFLSEQRLSELLLVNTGASMTGEAQSFLVRSLESSPDVKLSQPITQHVFFANTLYCQCSPMISRELSKNPSFVGLQISD